MNKIVFEDVKTFSAYKKLLFLNRSNSFECINLQTNSSVFKKDQDIYFHAIINDKCFAQFKNGSDIHVFDLAGNLIRLIEGQFYLWKYIVDVDMVVPGKSYKEGLTGYIIDLSSLDVKEKFEPYLKSLLLKGRIGCGWYANTVYGFNIVTGEEMWEYKGEEGVKVEPRYCFLNEDHVIVTFSDAKLVSLNINTGELLWKNEAQSLLLTMHPVNKNLYGIAGETYEVIDSKTGKQIIVKELAGISEHYEIEILAGYTRVYEDGLYFDSNKGSSKIGKINIEKGEIEFVEDLVISAGIQTAVPVSHEDWIIVNDQLDRLHVYRKS